MNCLTLAAATLHIASIHMPNHGYTGFNPGLGVEMECGLVAGFYRSSQSRDGEFKPIVYGGYTWHTRGRWQVGGSLVAAHGYERRRTGKDIPIVAMPTLWGTTPEVGRFRLAVGFLPPISTAPAVVHFTVKARIGARKD